MSDLISIIVPVYNVQNYLEKCLESILRQTYKNIEIILVDDGSTDTSGRICDQYCEEYPHMKVIHKTNGGLSDARNRGLEYAKGEYVVFVDSDDIIDENIIEYLYRLIKRERADIGICDPVHCYPDQIIKFEKADKESVFKFGEAIEEMLYQKSFLVSAWGKIYPTRYFENIKFPVGVLFEDAAVMYKLFDKAKRIVYGNAKLYGYVHRENSITTKKFSIHDGDILTICDQIDSYFKDREDGVKRAARSYHMAAALRMYLNAPREEKFETIIRISKAFLDANCDDTLRDYKIRRKMRIALLLYKYARPIMPIIYDRIDRWK